MLKQFEYKGITVRAINKNGEVWFVAKDVCNALNISNLLDAISILDNDEKSSILISDGILKNPNQIVVNEFGVYNLVLSNCNHEAKEFKRWVTHEVIPSIHKQHYYLDEQKLPNNQENLEAVAREVNALRLNEKNQYKQLIGLFATSHDYDPKSDLSKAFFAKVQNMFHYAIHQHTAPELINERCDSSKPCLGQNSYGKATLDSAIIAKNYLTKQELEQMTYLVNGIFDFAAFQYLKGRSIYMKDWLPRLNGLLQMYKVPILEDAGRIKRKDIDQKVKQELRKYKANSIH